MKRLNEIVAKKQHNMAVALTTTQQQTRTYGSHRDCLTSKVARVSQRLPNKHGSLRLPNKHGRKALTETA